MAEIVLTNKEREALERAAEMMRNAAELQTSDYWESVYKGRAETIESLLARAGKEGVWIEWSGGERPVPMGTLVDVVHRDGYKYCNQLAGASGSHAEDWSWMDDHPSDIVGYRIVPRE